VRHAHAGDKRLWRDPDEARPLSPRGEAQAAGLLVTLAGDVVEEAWSSPALRCTQTLAPLARQRGLDVHSTPLLAKEVEAAELLGWLRARGPDARALVCTHGEVLRGLFDLCRDQGLIGESVGLDTPKGGGWRLHSPADTAVPPAGPVLLLDYLAPRLLR